MMIHKITQFISEAVNTLYKKWRHTDLPLVNYKVYWPDIGNLIYVLAYNWSFVLYNVIFYRHDKQLHNFSMSPPGTFQCSIFPSSKHQAVSSQPQGRMFLQSYNFVKYFIIIWSKIVIRFFKFWQLLNQLS